MPFTPFHFGPGAFVKSIAPKKFSFLIFVFSQVMIDFETLYFITKDQYPLHRLFHTYLGCHIPMIVTIIIGAPIRSAVIRTWNFMTNMNLPNKLSFKCILISAAIGAYSHVFLDSIMHRDIRPFYPFSNDNPMLGVMNIGLLHWLCILSGLVGAGLLMLRKYPASFKS